MRYAAAIRAFISALLTMLAMTSVATADVRYDVTAIESRQLSNAVQITIMSNGNVTFNMDKWVDGGYYYDPSVTSGANIRATKIIGMNLANARSKVGDYVYIGKYPVSHIELSVPPEREIRHGREVGESLDIVVCLYTGAKLQMVDGGAFEDSNPDVYLSDAAQLFKAMRTSDNRGIIVTIMSDQRRSILDRRKADIDKSKSELNIGYANDLLSVHAKDVQLKDLITAVANTVGKRIQVEPGTDRLVCAELPEISLDDFIDRISDSYGLDHSQSGGVTTISDVMARTSSAYTASSTCRIPVRNIKAEAARELLPTFLMEYIGIDKAHNELIVTGSQKLVEKIQSDLQLIDKPTPMITIKARLVEISSSSNLSHNMQLEGSNKDFLTQLNSTTGNILFTKSDMLPSALEAKLSDMVDSHQAIVHSEASITTLSGESGQVFAGLNKYVLVPGTYPGSAKAIPVTAGTKLKVIPRIGKNTITVWLNASVTEVEEIDPATNMPTVNTRTVEGSYRINSGETLLISGLTQSQEYMTTRKIPILGSLPVIGRFFRSKTKQRAASEFVLLITPTAV